MKHIGKKYVLALLALSVLMVWVGVSSRGGTKGTVAHLGAEATSTATVLQGGTSTIPIRVSGAVVASEYAVVAAQTGGVIAEYAVREGSAVGAGALLVRQETPVAGAEYARSLAEAALRDAEQDTLLDRAAYATRVALVETLSAEDSARLRSVSADNRVQEASQAVNTTAQAGVGTLLAGLQFVDTHRSLFDAESLETYRAVVTELYGSLPNHFQGGGVYPRASTGDLQALLDALAQEELAPVLDIQNTATLLSVELNTLVSVYRAAEADVLDQQKTTPDGEVYTAYFSQRQALVSARAALVQAQAHLEEMVDVAAQTQEHDSATIAVRALDREAAERQVLFAQAVQRAVGAAADAQVRVAQAQQALGEVRAAFPGVVTKRYKREGEYALPGEPLLALSGTAGREVEVSVPRVFAPLLRTGLPFIVEGETVGFVDRFSTGGVGGAVPVFIVFTDKRYTAGETVVGSIEVHGDGMIFALPRAYVHFSSTGTYVRTRDGADVPVRIVYDTGALLYVSAPELAPESLVPLYSIALP